jgi:hypothetical protein
MGKSVKTKISEFFTCNFFEPGASKIAKNGMILTFGQLRFRS